MRRRRNQFRDMLRETLILVGLPRSYFTKRRTRARVLDFRAALQHLRPSYRAEARKLWG